MQTKEGKEIAEEICQLNINLATWSRFHLDQVFSVNGRGPDGLLTLQQFHMLLYFSEYGQTTVSALAEHLSLSKSSTSLSISKLVSKGYLAREAASGEGDKRRVYFHLTEKGRQVMEKTQVGFLSGVGAFFDSYNAQTRLAIYKHLEAINLLLSGGKKE